MSDRLAASLGSYLADPTVAWSLGSFGAIAEFIRGHGEASAMARDEPLSLVTARGGIAIRLSDAMRAFSYTTPSRHAGRRHPAVAFCFAHDECALARRAVVTELGPDTHALRDENRDAILFDVGLCQWQVDVCVRSADPYTLTRLRAFVGLSIFDRANALMSELPGLSPHRVFLSRAGRIEVYQDIPPADGRSPDGPHTHVLPKLLRAARTHAANVLVPTGFVPCLTAHLSAPREGDHGGDDHTEAGHSDEEAGPA